MVLEADPRGALSNGARTDGSAAISVHELSCSYGGVQAVRGVTFEVEEGSFTGIIGPNGAGKSTLVDCISGRNQDYRGRVTAWGADITRNGLSKVAAMGIIRSFQVARPFGKLTVLSNLMTGPRGQLGERFHKAILGGWRSQEDEFLIEAWGNIDLFGLSRVADSYGSELSGGQERLVELSRAVMCHPKAMILDEPFAGVSPANRELLADLLRKLCHDQGITILMVEHRLEWVERLCPRILVMAEGQVIQDGSMASIRQDTRVLEAYLGYA
jgi:ABC-type branched-subunit amino acid transport system ATPase component